MPRTHPEQPVSREDDGALQRVRQALRGHLPARADVLTGVVLQDGATTLEVDLLVVWPGVGLAVIEVAGGHVSCLDGAWWQGSGAGRRRIDPVGRVRSTTRTLLGLLERDGLAAARSATGQLVAVPHVYVPATWDAPEAPRGTLLDRAQLTDGGPAVHAVRRAITNHGGGFPPLDDAAAAALVDWAAGRVPTATAVAADARG
ncbi:nuclease-related domain-containing protein [Cellulomonas phragmiteti]|uniref:NERD domain-containing protein n=1 Tax=Cellulomonas phragmiteti TaxID=478780 RepID=A0ABQ4DRB9_9CELL|nr:nuclease-related domain-containing protein [Cellulomonas phragmiteti]GIG41907.1 hypothetical protein Cph01nite_36690 [Cellulomonas phragmiteti]